MQKENNLISYKEPKSPVSESFRTLRTNIQFMGLGSNVKTILITSSCSGEGKSTISSNLAIVFAQQGKNVLLIDADMRRGKLKEVFGVKSKCGLSNYLANMEYNENNFINQTNIDNLFVITSGNVPPNPSELLTSERMSKLIEQCKEKFDVIILDGPPCLVVADGLILTKHADTTIIVSAVKETLKDELKNTKKAIENVGGKIGGVILNKMDISSNIYSKKRYYSYYSKDKEKV